MTSLYWIRALTVRSYVRHYMKYHIFPCRFPVSPWWQFSFAVLGQTSAAHQRRKEGRHQHLRHAPAPTTTHIPGSRLRHQEHVHGPRRGVLYNRVSRWGHQGKIEKKRDIKTVQEPISPRVYELIIWRKIPLAIPLALFLFWMIRSGYNFALATTAELKVADLIVEWNGPSFVSYSGVGSVGTHSDVFLPWWACQELHLP